VLPLIRANGRDVSTRQIADAAGVAEGTIFRAFGDKESLINAAIAQLFDPLPLILALQRIDATLPLEVRVAEVIVALRDRFSQVRAVMASLGLHARPPIDDSSRLHWLQALEEVFAADTDRLAIPVSEFAQYLRLLAFSSAIEPIAGDRPLSAAQLAGLVVTGALRPGEQAVCPHHLVTEPPTTEN